MFVTLPGVIKPKELPPEVGLYTLNMRYPLNDKPPLIASKHPAARKMELGLRNYILENLIWWYPEDPSRKGFFEEDKTYKARLAERIRRMQIHGVR